MSAIQQVLATIGISSLPMTFLAAGAVGTGANPTAALPATHSAGNLLVIVGASGTNSFSTPAGWSPGAINGTTSKLSLWYKIDNGAESNVVVSNSNAQSKVVMLSYSGNNAAPSDTAGTPTSGSTASPTTVTLTTATDNALIISAYGAVKTGAAWSAAPGSTNSRVSSNATSSLAGLLVVDETLTLAGASAARAATLAGASNWDAYSHAFKVA